MAERTRRKNGLWPPSKRQLVTIVVCLANAVAFGAVLAPLLSPTCRWLMLSVFSATFAATTAAGMLTMIVDPIDPLVAGEEDVDSSDSDEVSWYCRRCQSHVQEKSKHCGDCNKCVSNFDHHCDWLNTCIGGRNYDAFYAAIWSLLAMLGVVIIVAALLLVKVLREPLGESSSVLGLSTVQLVVVLSTLVAVNMVFWLLDLTLVAAHVYFRFRGLSTYDYIVMKRREREAGMAETRREGRRGLQASEAATAGALPREEPRKPPDLSLLPRPRQEEEDEAEEEGGAGRESEEPADQLDATFRAVLAEDDEIGIFGSFRGEVSSFVFGSPMSSVADPSEDAAVEEVACAQSEPRARSPAQNWRD